MVRRSPKKNDKREWGTRALMSTLVGVCVALALNDHHASLYVRESEVYFLHDDVENFWPQPPMMRQVWAAVSDLRGVLGVYEPVTVLFRAFVCRGSMRIASAVGPWLHGLNMSLASWLCSRYVRQPELCFVAALVVGLDADRVEVVAWPSANGYLLATLFSLLAAVSCSPVTRVTFLTLAVFSKAAAVSVCALLILKAILLDQSSWRMRHVVAEWVAMLFVSSLAAMTAVFAASTEQGPPTTWISRASRALAILGRRFDKRHRAVRYFVPDAFPDYTAHAVGCAMLGFVSLSCLVLFARHRWWPWVPAVYVILSLPTLGIVSDHIVTLGADRYTYLPETLTLVPALAACFQYKRNLVAAAPAILAWNARNARLQLARWRSNALLCEDMEAASQGFDPVPLVHRALSKSTSSAERLDMLRTIVTRGDKVVLAPKVYLNLAHYEPNATAAAIALGKVAALEPTMPGLREETEALLAKTRAAYDVASLQLHLDLVANVAPWLPTTYKAGPLSDLGTLFAKSDADRAERLFARAVDADPAHFEANFNLASLRAKRGAYSPALQAALAALAANPKDIRAVDLVHNIQVAIDHYEGTPISARPKESASGLPLGSSD